MKKLSTLTLAFCALAMILSMAACEKEPVGSATVTTNAVTEITGTTAKGGGGIETSEETSSYGLVWSTSTNPTTDDEIAVVGFSAVDSFTTTMAGLQPVTTYYVRAYAVTDAGKSYGNQVSFTTTMSIGASYQGGYIGYLFQPGDAGYVAGENHGLIVAGSDQSSSAIWGCEGTSISGTSEDIGTGRQNTQIIVSNCATSGIAAKLCDDLVLGGYSDWYLPSIDELQAINRNFTEIPTLPPGGHSYVSSSQSSSTQVWGVYLHSSVTFPADNYGKSTPFYVRAVRTF